MGLYCILAKVALVAVELCEFALVSGFIFLKDFGVLFFSVGTD